MSVRRKRWYYGVGVGQRILHVFSSAMEPTEASHGHWVRYAVGPYSSQHAAIDGARRSQVYPGYPVFVKQKGPYSKKVWD